MTQLSAFVGHSFLEIDESVVSRILKMLDIISKLMPGFEWDHAQAAEPRELSQKVKEKMKGKNLFIGICTPKEQVIEPSMLRPRLWPFQGELCAERQRFQSKTSDWILQEIGMAVGKDMQVVLLIEAGLRRPGGLQGDLEYIEFERAQPERSLEKLAQMLRSLSPSAIPSVDARERAPSIETPKDASSDEKVLQYLTPNPSWSAGTYASRYRLAIQFEDARASQILEAFTASIYQADPHARSRFEAAGISGRVAAHKGEWVGPLRELIKRFPNTSGPYESLGERFSEAGDYVRAAENYALAAQFATVAAKKLELLIESAAQSVKGKQPNHEPSHIAAISDLIMEHPALEVDAMAGLAALWKSAGNGEMFTACAERVLEIEPDRTQPRFDLAYKYSEVGLEDHALFHYRQYLKVKNDPDAWNNLGVAAVANKLPIAAMDAYRIAADAGNSLAIGNLAFSFIEAGFLPEALEQCNKGLRAEKPHPRLFDAKARCDRSREEEDEKELKILDETEDRRMVLRAIGHHSIMKRITPMPDRWLGPHCPLTAAIVGSELILTGSYIREVSPGLGELLLGDTKKRERRYNVVYSGKLYGRAFIGKVKTEIEGAASTSLLGADEGQECIGTINESGTVMELFENKKRIMLRVFRELIPAVS